MNTVYRVIMPKLEYCDNFKLFIRKEFLDGVAKYNVYKFNTWMNAFPARKISNYCNINKLFLTIDARGSYDVQIVGTKINYAYKYINEVIKTKKCTNKSCIEIEEYYLYDSLYFSIFEKINNPIEICSISWDTTSTPERINKLAIITCTYKREEYIYKTIGVYNKFIENNKEQKENSVLIVVDNGRTLGISKSQNVKIIPNINAGGAGGFARGMIEVQKNFQNFTRILLIDDDVEIFPEAFERTITISNYLKYEYKDAFINGAMLNLYNKNIFVENLSMQHGLWSKGFHDSCDINDYFNVIKTNCIPDEIFGSDNRNYHSAWWYCSFSTNYISENGLPFPCFFRGDDLEWGWRRNKSTPIICLNGICIWHAPFTWRVSKVADYYYLPRNMFYINMLHTKDFKNRYKIYYKRMANYLIDTYDYTTLEIFIQALRDILKGPKVFCEDPEIQFNGISNLDHKKRFIQENNVNNLFALKMNRSKSLLRRIKRIVWKSTLNGLLCPNIFLKKYDKTISWFPPVNDFIFVKKVRVYNLSTGVYEDRVFDRRKALKYRLKIRELISDIDRNYDMLYDEIKNQYKIFKTISFWERYLNIEFCQSRA